MTHFFAAMLAAPSLVALAAPAAAVEPDDVLVVARHQQQSIDQAPASSASIDADRIATTINATNVEDTIKYLPSLTVRKRHIGDTQAPLATRTSGLGSSARALIYADGALLSALIGNNNTIASPRWSLVGAQDIARVDVLYGPFSAAYPGNSIGAVVNITTRLPDAFEATANAGINIQTFDQYGTRRTLPAYQAGLTIGDRFGPLAVFASYDHVTSNGQPLTYVTALRSGTAAASSVTGGFDALNRTGAVIRILGASGLEHQRQDRIKLKAAIDVTSGIRLTYVGALFFNNSQAEAESYLTGIASGLPVFAGSIGIDGRAYTIAPNAFSGGVYDYGERHWSHSLSATGTSDRIDWQMVGTSYDFARDLQRMPTAALPTAQSGGTGTITRLDGTGWATIDAKATWRSDVNATHSISAGIHYDRFLLDSRRFLTSDWVSGHEGARDLQSRGRTRTAAVWAQDAWKLVPAVTVTVGGRYESWRAFDGFNFTATPAISVVQPARKATRFSPKATLAWQIAPQWTLRASFGQAYRFPTVAELYQVVTTPVPATPNPDLRPERARSEELAFERRDDHGSARLSLFNESIEDALISQTGLLNGTTTLATFVQNVPRTRARGAELAFDRTNVLPTFDLVGSATFADAETRVNPALPASVGRRLPSVPRWKATLVGTWHASQKVSLSVAARYSSRNYGTLDNSDLVGNTYQGFYKYLVVDLRAAVRVGEQATLGLGVDNVGNDKYFLFHPFPQRSFQADLTFKL